MKKQRGRYKGSGKKMRMSGDERCHYHPSNGEAQGSPALVCIAPISLLRTVYLSNLSGMYESLFNRDNKSRGEERVTMRRSHPRQAAASEQGRVLA